MATQIITAATPSPRSIAAALRENSATAVFIASLVIGVFARVQYGRGMPLWFDETFTATIATQPSLPALVRWCLTELTGPAFYAPMWLWVKAFGASDLALRAPSVILSIAAPLLLWRWGHPDRIVRLAWASLLLLWLPVFPFAHDARPYAQIVFLACAQAIAFLRLLRAPTQRTALLWTSITAVLALTHYTTLPIGLVQGCAYLALHRGRAVATWPALVPFVPVAIWIAFHLSFMMSMTMGGSGQPSLSLSDLAMLPEMLFGIGTIGVLVLGIVLATIVLPRYRPVGRPFAALPDRLLALSGVVALVGLIGLALFHAGFAPRYLTPLIPALLFGLALWVRWVTGNGGKPALLMFAIMLPAAATMAWNAAATARVDARHLFSFEAASAWLARDAPERLVFVWADAIGDASLDRNVADIAGHAFRRLGRPVSVTVVHRMPGRDTSARVRAAADTGPGTAILWVANDRELTDRTIPRIAQQDARWDCRDFGGDAVTIVACRRRA